jgi:hypothetical protein
LVVGERALESGKLEYRQRRDSESTEIPAADAVAYLTDKVRG